MFQQTERVPLERLGRLGAHAPLLRPPDLVHRVRGEAFNDVGAPLFVQVAERDEKIVELEKELRERAREDEQTMRLMSVPGIGPLCAMVIPAFALPMESFRCGRDFAAWLGLVPGQSSTGGKPFSQVLRRGLDRGYRERAEDTRRPRGELDLPPTVRRALRVRGQVRVRYEELSRDVLHNRIIKTTMQRLAAVETLNTGLKSNLTRLVQRIADISDVDLREDLFRRVQIHRNNADYGFLLDLCRLITRHLFPEARAGAVRFRDFTTDEREMGRLFEDFVRGFLRKEHPGLGISGHKIIRWGEVPEGDIVLRFPMMETDIYVPGAGGRSVIVETKCVSGPFDRGRGVSTDALRSDHLYQLFAYLMNYARSYPAEPPALGVLLYATTGTTFDYRYRLHGHPLWVSSVDLAKPWPTVRKGLDRLAQTLSGHKGPHARAVA